MDLYLKDPKSNIFTSSKILLPFEKVLSIWTEYAQRKVDTEVVVNQNSRKK